MERVKIGLLGLGTVGRGVYDLLQQNGTQITQKLGASLEIKRILVKNPLKHQDVPPQLLTDNFKEILDDPEIMIIVELMGQIEPARTYIMESMRCNKSVVTANKDILAEFGKELFETEDETQVDFLFEGSVAGGIPIIRALKESLAANRIEEIKGIVNGTTNYILTQMEDYGADFDSALREAQEKGYAEADPSADIDGLDAARKMAILASIAFNSRITLKDVYSEGIRNIAPEDILYARNLGYIIKSLGIAKERREGIEVRVHPALLPLNHPLASVRDEFNAVFVYGFPVGETMFYGKGAGAGPTASAVVADIMEAARNIIRNDRARIGCTCFEQKPVLTVEEVETPYYIRMFVIDRPGVLSGIAGVFGNQQVSLRNVIQQRTIGEEGAELVFITHKVKERNLRDALTILNGLSTVDKIVSVIRVEEK